MTNIEQTCIEIEINTFNLMNSDEQFDNIKIPFVLLIEDIYGDIVS